MLTPCKIKPSPWRQTGSRRQSLQDRRGENLTMESIKSQLLWGAVLFNWFIFLIQGL